MSLSLLFAGGGTGGHIFPLIAVAQAVRAMHEDVSIVYVGTARGMEQRILGDLGERLELLDIMPIKGGGVKGAVRGVVRAATSLPQAYRLIHRVQPSAVLSLGGYAAGPVSLAARVHGVPLAILEPNSVLGLSNLLVAPLAQRAYLTFEQTKRWFRASQIMMTGVPLRQGFCPRDYDGEPGVFRVLVMGGSQGAAALNQTVPLAIASVCEASNLDVRVVHQCGRGNCDEVLQRYEHSGVGKRASVVPFIDDIPSALAEADLVICRAGASALAEACAIGRPAVLIPYPYAAANHQLHNAMALQAAGAAVCIESTAATREGLADQLLSLGRNLERRQAMAKAARRHGKPDAARTVAQDLMTLAQSRSEDA